jgi:hypothetical protein
MEKEFKAKRFMRSARKHKQREKYNAMGYCVRETPKIHSSCRCCGNPRRMGKGADKLTLQERKARWSIAESAEIWINGS